MRLVALAVALSTMAASAQDARLAALHKTLVVLSSQRARATIQTLGASPELTVAKHQLRNWIEVQLGSLKDDEDEKALADRINRTLKSAGLTDSGDEQNFLGSLGEVRLSTESGLLIITTGVGILCQMDESAYAYKSVNGRWQRIWESEQNDYSPQKYSPQQIVAVHADLPFIMTLGNDGWCTSAWHPDYYRIWRVDSAGAKLLIDRRESAFLRTYTYIVGSIVRNDALIEFTEAGIGGDVREAVRHFVIDGDQIRHVDPVALGPRDFVDEWLTRGWDESASWSATPSLRRWHSKLHADIVAGDFTNLTMHCETPDLWQVAFKPAPQPDVFFLIRWRPPYHFTMMNISDKPWPSCTQKDPEADEWRTLSATQGWRQ